MHRVDIKGYVPGAIGRIAELHAVQYKKVYLWTFQGLNTARHLYEKCGFKLVEEHEGTQWGKTVIEQKFLLEL